MFERFTQRLCSVMVDAQEHARVLGYRRVECGHILLAFFERRKSHDYESYVADVLAEFGVNRQDLERLMVEGAVRDGGNGGEFPYSEEVKKVFELALQEALKLGQLMIDTGHVLLGMLRRQDSSARRLFRRLGMSLEMMSELEDAMKDACLEYGSDEGPGERAEPLEGTKFTDVEVRRILGRLFESARQEMMIHFMESHPQGAEMAVLMVDARLKALGVPNLTKSACVRQVVDLEHLVKLLGKTDIMERVDEELRAAVWKFVEICRQKYQEYVLGR